MVSKETKTKLKVIIMELVGHLITYLAIKMLSKVTEIMYSETKMVLMVVPIIFLVIVTIYKAIKIKLWVVSMESMGL